MKVCVVIVTYNPSKWLDRCFPSLRQSTLPLDVIVIDNGSTDGSQDSIKTQYPEVDFTQSDKNLGFGKANNIGIRKAYDAGADYVFLLNQDAWIAPDAIEKLVAKAQQNPDYGILSPVQMDGSGKMLEHYFAYFSIQYGSYQLYSDLMRKTDLKPIYDCDFIPAAAWLISRQNIEAVGGFDTVFFHYGEDNNYCQRSLYHGFKIGIDPDSFVCHDSVKDKKAIETNKYKINRYRSMFLNKAGDVNKGKPRNSFFFFLKYLFRNFLFSVLMFNFRESLLIIQYFFVVINNYGAAKKSMIRNRQRGLNYI